MTQTNEQDEVCVCGQVKSQHVTSRHPFTPQGEELKLPEKPKMSNDAQVVKRDGAQTQSMARLLTILREKGILDDDEVLRVVGIGE